MRPFLDRIWGLEPPAVCVFIVDPSCQEGYTCGIDCGFKETYGAMTTVVDSMLPMFGKKWFAVPREKQTELTREIDRFRKADSSAITVLPGELQYSECCKKASYLILIYGLSIEYKENVIATRAYRFLQKKFEPDKPYMTYYLGLNFTIYDMNSGSPVHHEREKQDDKIVSDGVGEIVEKLLDNLMCKIRKH